VSFTASKSLTFLSSAIPSFRSLRCSLTFAVSSLIVHTRYSVTMFHFSRSEKYSAVSDAEDTETLISGRSSSDSQWFAKQPKPGLSLRATVILLLACSFLMCSLGLYLGRCCPSNLGATRRVSKYCKLMAALRSRQTDILTAHFISADVGRH
jgi:hypothetical protein